MALLILVRVNMSDPQRENLDQLSNEPLSIGDIPRRIQRPLDPLLPFLIGHLPTRDLSLPPRNPGIRGEGLRFSRMPVPVSAWLNSCPTD